MSKPLKELEEEYKSKRNNLLRQRDNEIDELLKGVERKYWQGIDRCSREILNDDDTTQLKNQIIDWGQWRDSRFKEQKALDFDTDQLFQSKIKSISKKLQNKYQCPVEPDALMKLNIDSVSPQVKQFIKTQFENKIKQIKQVEQKPIVERYKKQLDQLDKEYKPLLQPKAKDMTFSPVMPKYRM